MTFIPSKYQVNIFKEYVGSNNNIVINACPGSGKTRTILELLKLTPVYKKSIYLCYNKSIAEDLKKQAPKNIDISTVHSKGLSILYKTIKGKIKITDSKNYHFTRIVLGDKQFKNKKDQARYFFTICELINFYRLNMISNKRDFIELAELNNFCILNGEIDDSLKVIDSIDKYNLKDNSEFMIDFTDMLYLPLVLKNAIYPQYDVLFIDEVQDITPLQKCLVDKFIKSKGRFVAVGDKKQLIYQFIGANLNSFQKFEQSQNTVVLPLSVSYRCPKAVVNEANKIFNEMEAFEENIKGEVRDGDINEIKIGDTVLCRNNMPLVEVFLYLLSKEIKTVIYGKDFGINLLNLLNKAYSKNVSKVKENFEKILSDMYSSLKVKGIKSPTYHLKYVSLNEKITILKILIDRFDSVEKVESVIDDMFSDDTKESVLLSTIHKAKGREWDTVFFLNENLIPSKYAMTKDEIYAESCLRYVCITRAKKKLIYINFLNE